MKSYLSLVSEYAKVHKKKNMLTLICIAISVMLVTAIFGMADLSVQAQISAYITQQGNFHASIKGITDRVAEQISSSPKIVELVHLKCASTRYAATASIFSCVEVLHNKGGLPFHAGMGALL